MYNLIVKGTQSQKLIDYVERVHTYLGLDRYHDCLVNVDFTPRCVGGAAGYANGDEDEVYVEIARSDLVGRIGIDDVKVNLAHEMVHALQLASGRLIQGGFVMVDHRLAAQNIWEGEELIGVPYDEQPWEIEAYKLEKEVYYACCK